MKPVLERIKKDSIKTMDETLLMLNGNRQFASLQTDFFSLITLRYERVITPSLGEIDFSRDEASFCLAGWVAPPPQERGR